MAFFRRVRGVRASLPSGSIIGRKSGGTGAAEIISAGDIVRAGSAAAPSPSPGGGGTGVGTDGQVWATVGSAAAWSFLSLLTKVGTIATGVWQGTKIALAYGGTNADLSATGGAHKFLRQNSAGAAVDVVQVDYSDLSGTQPTNAITQLTGDVTAGPGSGSQAATLATVNSNVGTFGDSTHVAQVTVNGKGLITAASNVAITGGGGGSGTVTSVAMTVPAELSVSGSPITTSGTLAVTWASEADNTLLSRIAGSSGVPSFNTLTAILDHALGNTNNRFAARISGSWTQAGISSLISAGSGVTITGTDTITISAAGSTTNNAQPVWPAPRLGNVRDLMWGDAGEFLNDGAAGTGPAGSGPAGGITIQWNTARRQGQFMTYDGVRWAAGTTINFNTAPIEPPSLPGLVQVASADGATAGFQVRNYGAAGAFFGTRANGTNAAKTGVIADDTLFSLGGAGYLSTGVYPTFLNCKVVFKSAEVQSGTAQGSYISLVTTAKGVAAVGSPPEVARFWNQGCYFVGTNTNDSAAAGNYGEYVSGSASAVSLVSATAKDLVTITLTAGDWDVNADASFVAAGTTTITKLAAWISTTTNTDPGPPNSGAYHSTTATFTTGSTNTFPTGTIRMSLTGSTVVRLEGAATFGTSTMTGGGFIQARRVR